jgi:hypothetical protein
MMQLQQGFATGEMGAGVRGQFGLHDSNSKPLMSVLGHFRPKQRTLLPGPLPLRPKNDIRSLMRKMVVMGQFLPHPPSKKATFFSRHTREVIHRSADW